MANGGAPGLITCYSYEIWEVSSCADLYKDITVEILDGYENIFMMKDEDRYLIHGGDTPAIYTPTFSLHNQFYSITTWPVLRNQPCRA